MRAVPSPSRSAWGFTSAEMLVATMIAGVVTGMAALAAYAITSAQHQYDSVATVTVPSGALPNFYGTSGTSVNTFIAPNYGCVAQAETISERFAEDVGQSVAVYPLSRASGTWNTVRPFDINSPPAGTILDTPDAFRAYLLTLYSGASAFTSYRNYPGTNNSFSIYLLGYSANATTIPVIAIYDLDIVTAQYPNTTTTMGYYVSLRRYVGGTVTNYYDCVFPLAGDGTDSWYPPVVSFERQSRKAIVEGSTTIDRFKVAEAQPFYLIFWPDPSRASLRLPSGNTLSSLNPNFANTDPRQAYNHMAGRTAYMFAVPAFPSS
jgi:hypothetical protein